MKLLQESIQTPVLFWNLPADEESHISGQFLEQHRRKKVTIRVCCNPKRFQTSDVCFNIVIQVAKTTEVTRRSNRVDTEQLVHMLVNNLLAVPKPSLQYRDGLFIVRGRKSQACNCLKCSASEERLQIVELVYGHQLIIVMDGRFVRVPEGDPLRNITCK